MNPSISELFDESQFEKVIELEHSDIKRFVIDQVQKRSRMIVLYSVYQFAMLFFAAGLLGYSLFKTFKGDSHILVIIAVSLAFGFSVLIVFHELIHGVAFKIVGAPKVSYGGYIRKMLFYAEADRFVANRKQFTIVALAPLTVIKLLTLAGCFIFLGEPIFWFFISTMCLHSLFCAGDIALLSFFYQSSDEYFTFDDKPAKKSYYFRRKTNIPC
jgi:hypothetical protein